MQSKYVSLSSRPSPQSVMELVNKTCKSLQGGLEEWREGVGWGCRPIYTYKKRNIHYDSAICQQLKGVVGGIKKRETFR